MHRSLVAHFRYALVWGKSSKFSPQPQKVGLTHQVQDEESVASLCFLFKGMVLTHFKYASSFQRGLYLYFLIFHDAISMPFSARLTRPLHPAFLQSDPRAGEPTKDGLFLRTHSGVTARTISLAR